MLMVCLLACTWIDDAAYNARTGGGDTAPDTDTDTDTVDADGDGFASVGSGGDDCDDADDHVFPGATEVCDGRANDCLTEAGWSTADEDGHVLWTDELGARTDVTATFAGGAGGEIPLAAGTWTFCGGSYLGNLVIEDAEVLVEGLYGAASTTLSGGDTGTTVSVNEGSVTLTGFELTGGTGTSDGTNTVGGGVLAQASEAPSGPTVTLVDCVVTGNTADLGGGIAATGAAWVSLDGTTVELNTSSGDGAGVYLEDGALDLVDAFVIDNDAGDDGGGMFIVNGVASVWAGAVRGNTAVDHGGGVALSADGSPTASFTAETVDFGVGTEENGPSDVDIKTGPEDYVDYTSYGGNATFTCSNATDACEP